MYLLLLLSMLSVVSLLKTETQLTAISFQPQSTHLGVPPKPLASGFVSMMAPHLFCKITNSLLATIYPTNTALLGTASREPWLYSSTIDWAPNPQSCESNCWDFLFWSLSLPCVWSWMTVLKFEPTSENCPEQWIIQACYLICFFVMILFLVFYPQFAIWIFLLFYLYTGILSLTIDII